MELTTLFTVLLVVGLLAGLIYFGWIRQPEEAEPPAEGSLSIPAPAEPAPRRPSRAERARALERRAKRRAARAAAAAEATGTGVAGAAATAAEDTAGEIIGVDATPDKPGKEPELSLDKPAEPEPKFESDSNPSAEAIAAAPSAEESEVPPADDLTRIKGLGPKAAMQLNSLGITRFAEMARWTPEQATAIDVRMGIFQGRMARDRWVEQAGYLARGDLAGFEEKFGGLG